MEFNYLEITNKLKNNINNCRVLVIGDLMLDKYYYGEVSRISPEAPVPIVKLKSEKKVPGGAANVANNLAHLGCKVLINGFVGKDENGIILRKLFKENDIDCSGIIESEIATTTKSRIIGSNQQMLRLDIEENKDFTDKYLVDFKKWLSKSLRLDIGAIILSDYGKGFCTEVVCQTVIKEANKAGVKVIVDPKGNNWNKYKGADFITPNIKELRDITISNLSNCDLDVEKYGTIVRNKFMIENLLVTRSEKGMTLINKVGVKHIQTEAKEVYDVSGAGDTVVAVLAAALSSNIEVLEAIKVSNIAASIVVGKSGTYAVSLSEIIEGMLSNCRRNEQYSKVMSTNDCVNLIRSWKKEGQKIVFTNGCFDILHIGHTTYLREAKKLGDKLIIGLNTDNSVRMLKGDNRPINNENDRAVMLEALECVDCVILFDESTPENLINIIRPDILVKGADYKIENVVGREYAKEVKLINFIESYSTTKLINKIIDINIKKHGEAAASNINT